MVADAVSGLLLASMAACAAFTAICQPTGAGIDCWFLYSYAAEFILPPVHALWLVSLATPGCTSWTYNACTSKPLVWLGKISYSLYCLHWPILTLTAWAVTGKGISAEAVPQYYGAYWWVYPGWSIPLLVALCVAIAAAAHYVLEAPARASISKRASPAVVIDFSAGHPGNGHP